MRYTKSVKCTTPETALIGLPPRPQIWLVKEQKINTHLAIFTKHYKHVLGRGASVFQFSPGHHRLVHDQGCVVLTGNRSSHSSYISLVMQKTTAVDLMHMIS